MRLFKAKVDEMEVKKDVKGLIAALQDKDFCVRRAAAAALGRTKDATVVESLKKSLTDKDGVVRENAALSLGFLGDASGSELLFQILIGNGLVDRIEAVTPLEKLGNISDPRIIAYLIKCINGSYIDQEFGEAVLRKIGAPSVEPLLSCLNDLNYQNFNTRIIALGILADIGDNRAVYSLIAYLKDPDISDYVIKALQKIGNDIAINAVKKFSEFEKMQKLALERIAEAISHPDLKVQEASMERMVEIFKVLRKETIETIDKTEISKAIDGLLKILFSSSTLFKIIDFGQYRHVEYVKLPRNIELANSTLRYLAPVSSLSRSIVIKHIRIHIFELAFSVNTYNQVSQDDFDPSTDTWEYSDSRFDLSEAFEAVESLCGENSPITSNILHFVANKKDFLAEKMGFTPSQLIEVGKLRESALNELQKRGNPSYDLQAYYKA
jgi:HEAT repeat protein